LSCADQIARYLRIRSRICGGKANFEVIRHRHDAADAFRVHFGLQLLAVAAHESREGYDAVLDRYADIGRIYTRVILELVFYIAFYLAISPGHDESPLLT